MSELVRYFESFGRGGALLRPAARALVPAAAGGGGAAARNTGGGIFGHVPAGAGPVRGKAPVRHGSAGREQKEGDG